MSSLPPAGGRRRHDSGGRAKKWPKLLVKRRSVHLFFWASRMWLGWKGHDMRPKMKGERRVAANHPLIHFPFTFGGMGYPRWV